MSTVAGVSSTSSSYTGETESRVPTQTLGQDDFLKLLVAQLTSQDPMNPQKDTDFIAQMAQFSALEQSKTLSSSVADLSARQEFSEAAALLGRTVDVSTTGNAVVRGAVTAVHVESGTPSLVVNGQSYKLSQVLSVTETLPE